MIMIVKTPGSQMGSPSAAIETFGRELESVVPRLKTQKKIRSKQPKNPRAPAARIVETAASTAMDRYVELVQQYPGQQQVDLDVEIQVPGSWFGVGPMGSLTTTERRDKYNAQTVEYCEVREFPGATRGARKTKEKAIRFICLADAADAPKFGRLLDEPVAVEPLPQ